MTMIPIWITLSLNYSEGQRKQAGRTMYHKKYNRPWKWAKHTMKKMRDILMIEVHFSWSYQKRYRNKAEIVNRGMMIKSLSLTKN
jgi:hypothetical protein